MDRIIMKNLQFYGYHGVFEEERKLGQRFHFDVELETSLKTPGRTDQLEDAINYVDIYNTIREKAEGPAFNLLEALGNAIAIALLDRFIAVNKVKVEVRKPEAPIPGVFDWVGIAVERTRDDL